MLSNDNPHDYPCICANSSSQKKNSKPELTKTCWVCAKIYCFHTFCIQGWYQKFHSRKKHLRYSELDFHTKNTKTNRFYCNTCLTVKCQKCNKKHNGGEITPVIMFCRGDAHHPKHWFRSITQCFPTRLQTNSVLDETHWYCCATNTTPVDEPKIDYILSHSASDIMNNLNDGDNVPEYPFTHNGNDAEKFNNAFPYHYLRQVLEMDYFEDILHHNIPAPITTLKDLVKSIHCFTEAHRQFCELKNKKQALILYNCFPGFNGIGIDELYSLLYSGDDSLSQPSNCHGISSSIIQLIAHSTNWFMESSIGIKWGIQTKCVCNTSGTYNLTDINPVVDTDTQSSRQYCTAMSNELAKHWDNHTMYTQQLHSFGLDTYIKVS